MTPDKITGPNAGGPHQFPIQRHRIKTTECAFPFYRGIGFSKLRWDKDDIVGFTRDDKEVFRFNTGLEA